MNEQSTANASRRHYIKVFCTFFSLITSFSAILVLTEACTNYTWYLVFFWLLGVISAVLVAPVKFLKFGASIISFCASFGWHFLPWPFDLTFAVASVAVGLAAAIVSLFCIPPIFTLYIYITDIRYECTDRPTEITAILSGILAAALIRGIFLTASAA